MARADGSDGAFLKDYLTRLRLFSRNARLFLAGTFFFGFGLGTYWVLLNLYLRELGLTDALIGRVLSSESLGTLLFALPASYLTSRVRLKWILVAAAVSTACASSLLVLLRPLPLLLLVGAWTGGSYVIHFVISAPFFMRNSTSEERLHLFGINYAVEILCSVIGVAAGGALARHLGITLGSDLLGYRITLLGASAIVACAVVPYLLIHSPPPTPAERESFRGLGRRRPRDLGKLLAPNFLLGCGAGLIIPFLNLYFRDRFALDSRAIGAVFAVSQALTAVGFAAGPSLAKRFGMVRTVTWAQYLSIPFFLALAFTTWLPVAVGAFWMRGALMNMNHPISRNFAMEVVDPEHQPMTNAGLEMSWSLAWMVSTQIGGWIIQHHGYTLPMLITVGLYLVSASSFVFFFHDYEGRVLAPKRLAEAEEAAVP